MRKLVPALLLSLLAIFGCGTSVIVSDSISPLGPVTLDAGQSVTLTANVAGDSSNAGVTWSLTGAGTLSGQTSTNVIYTAPSPVTAAASAVVTAVPVKNTLYAAATQINYGPAPAFTSSSLPTATLNVAYSFQLAATGGSAPLAFSLVSGTLPAGLSLSSAGLLSGTPTALGSTPLTLQVTDSASTPLSARVTLTLNVVATTLNISSASTPNGVTGAAYSASFTASGGAVPYTWSVASGALPTGLTLSSAGVLSGTPTTAGTYSFTAKVTDTEPSPQTATKALTLTIYPALSISTSSLPNGSLKNSYSSQLSFNGGVQPVTWSLATGSLPAGLTLSTSGLISGTPTAAGSSSFTVRLTDSSSPAQTVTASLTITIVTSTLAITTTTLPAATVTAPYSTTLQSSGGNSPITWSLAAGSTLPPGLTLSSTGVISGKPTAVGTYAFTVQATDATPATVTQTLSLMVDSLSALTVATTTLPSGNIGAAYSSTLTATGGATPYTWTVATGALPPGLTLSTAGLLSGTPLAAGSYNVTIQVQDSEAAPSTASRAFSIVIGTTLPAGTANAELSGAYAFQLNGFLPGKAAGQVYGFASIGSLSFDGAGNVTGIEDLNTPTGSQTSVTVSGTYSLSANNRGLLVLTAGTATNVYAIAASQFSASVAQSLALTEFDNTTGTGNTASGFARHQTAAAFSAKTLAGTFAFGLAGESPSSAAATGVKLGPVAAVGLFSGDGAATVSAGQEDAAAYSANYSGITLAGSYTAPSTTTGRGTLKLTPTGTIFAAPPTNYTFVVVSATEILMLSTDTHASYTLLYGDARLQQQASYSAASLTGRSIGFESQASGGDGATTLPSTLNAILSEFTITGSGTATLEQDANRAGTFATAATSVTYTTATTGRTAVVTGANNLILYLYNTGAGFALDTAGTAAYPGLAQFELQVSATPYPTLLNGMYAAATLGTPVAAAIQSGIDTFALNTGGVNSAVSGALTTTIDSSSPAGTLALGQTASLLYLEDATARTVVSAPGTTTPTSIVYAITSARAVALSATSTTPTVTVLQQ